MRQLPPPKSSPIAALSAAGDGGFNDGGIHILLLCLGASIALCLAARLGMGGLVAVATLLIQTGFAFGPMGGFTFTKLLGWLPAIALGLLAYRPIRPSGGDRAGLPHGQNRLPPSPPPSARRPGRHGRWDAELFSGSRIGNKLRRVAPITLTAEEREFLDGPTTENSASKLNDWHIRHELHDVPEEIWQFVQATTAFSACSFPRSMAASASLPRRSRLILGKISSRSPGRRRHRHGAELARTRRADREIRHGRAEGAFLPRLARGEEVPCFALTGPFSGSDAASMRDIGVVTRGHA